MLNNKKATKESFKGLPNKNDPKSSPQQQPGVQSKFIWPDRLLYQLWKLVNEEWIIAKWYNCLSDICGVDFKYTNTGIRDAIYKKIMLFWPENWMSKDQLYTAYSSILDRIKAANPSLYTEQQL